MTKQKIKVSWKEKHEGTIDIEANSKQEAIQKIKDDYDTGYLIEDIIESGSVKYNGIDYDSIKVGNQRCSEW